MDHENGQGILGIFHVSTGVVACFISAANYQTCTVSQKLMVISLNILLIEDLEIPKNFSKKKQQHHVVEFAELYLAPK
jgi:hypothetical protein